MDRLKARNCVRAGRCLLLLAVLLAPAPFARASEESPSVRLVSRAASPISPQAAGGTSPSMSADGRYLVFVSSRHVVPGQIDTNGAEDVFLLDRQTGVARLVSHVAGSFVRAGSGKSGNCGGSSGGPSAVISADGRFVAFCSYSGDLLPGLPWGRHVYLYSRLDQSITLVDHLPGTPGTAATCYSDHLAISGDGSHVAFRSDCMELVGGTQGFGGGLAGLPVRARERPGAARLAYHTVGDDPPGPYIPTPGSGPSISADGTLVAFTSAANLLSDGGEPIPPQVYLYRLADRRVSLVSRAADALVPGNGSADRTLISADGRFVAYSSYATIS